MRVERILTVRRGFGALLVAACCSMVVAAPPSKVALTNVRIVPVSGPPIAQGTVLIEGGKIVAVGEDVKVPYDAREFDLSGKVVMPGMVVAHTWRGMDIPNESRPVVPQLDAADAIDPSQLYFEECLRLGHTVVHVMPANNTVVGGLGQVVRPIGLSVAEMTIDDGGFMKLSMAPRRGSDRMLQMATLREAFAELQDYVARLAETKYEEKLAKEEREIDVLPVEARKRGRKELKADHIDDEHRNLIRLKGGQVTVEGESGPTLFSPLGAFVYCGSAMDVPRAIAFAKAHGFFDRLVLVLGGDSHKAIKALKKAARPVVLPENLVYRDVDPFTNKIEETFVPKVIADAGLQFALLPGPSASLPERMLTYQAARCMRYGISRTDALRAITQMPAEIIGVGERLGSIEVGKDAHLVVFSGDPLEFTSVVERVFIDGIPAYDRSEDIRLKRLLTTKSDESADDEQ